jgi:cytochrome c oxidase assembly protein subunit 11
MPWTFTADQLSQRVNIGATSLAFFRVRNDSSRPVTGRAVFNVTPETAGGYFVKLECFCFREQTLQPGQTMDFPVVYYVDPRLATDPETRDFQALTLSYTFLPSVNPPPPQRTAALAPPGLGEAARAGL